MAPMQGSNGDGVGGRQGTRFPPFAWPPCSESARYLCTKPNPLAIEFQKIGEMVSTSNTLHRDTEAKLDLTVTVCLLCFVLRSCRQNIIVVQ